MTVTSKSSSITNLDLVSAGTGSMTFPTAGSGGQDYLCDINDSVTPVSAANGANIGAGDIWDAVRIPTHAMVKQVLINIQGATTSAAGTITADIDVLYSDNGPFDGSNPSNSGVVQVASADNKLFGAAVSLEAASSASPATQKDVTFSGSFTLANQNSPLWQVLGLASDPGGYFDIAAKIVTATSVTGTATFGAEVKYSAKQ